MNKQQQAFLEKYLNNSAPTGFETSGQKIWLDYLKNETEETIVDSYGSVAAIINPGKKYKVVIEAHADEISWFVNYIDDKGYIYVCRNGGSDHMIAPSKRVNIYTEKGVVKGVFGWPAIHVRERGKEKVPQVHELFVDIGCENKKEVEQLGVHVGCVMTFEDELTSLGKNLIVGRALDNRIGGYMIAEVAKRIVKNKIDLDYSLYVVNAVQEEIGLRGAEMISRKIKPDLAIITDVTHDTHSPMYNIKKSGDIKCGRGPALAYGPAVQNNVLKQIINTAKKHKIEIQRYAVSRSTGTDTDAFAYSSEGVPSALVSLALKYMHTTVESVHRNDIESVIDLMYNFLVELKPGEDFKYL